MSTVSLKNASLSGAVKSNSLLAGNVAFEPLPPSAYDLLETTILTSSASSVSFTGLGSYTDYKHLQIRTVGHSNRATAGDGAYVTVNGDSGANYARHGLVGNGSSVSSFGLANQTFMGLIELDSDGNGADVYSPTIIDILDFSDASKSTTFRALSGRSADISLRSGLYIPTTAITSINMQSVNGTYQTGSRFSLYGIKAA